MMINGRCELHQPSLRRHLLTQFEDADDCLRGVLRRQMLYLYFPTIMLLGELDAKVKTALQSAFDQPVRDDLRNLLIQPPRDVLRQLLREPLHQVGVIEYRGKTAWDFDDPELGSEVHEYVIRLDRLTELFQSLLTQFDVQRSIRCLQGEIGISEQLLIEKYEALFVLPLSHYRARRALKHLEGMNVIKNNGNRRKIGYDVLKYS